mgnify:CR=1 FL=1
MYAVFISMVSVVGKSPSGSSAWLMLRKLSRGGMAGDEIDPLIVEKNY